MKRRDFLKWVAVSATSLTVTVSCAPLVQAIIPTQAAKSTTLPTRLPPAAVPTPAPTTLPPAAMPTSGPVPVAQVLVGNSNYHLHSNCSPVTGLVVTTEITKDLVSDIGFSIQLNGYSPQDANCTWQQYGFVLSTNGDSPLDVIAFVDNWPSTSFGQKLGLPAGNNIINHREKMLTLPGATLPAGYKFIITLKYDQKENVNGVSYVVVDNKGKQTHLDMMLESLTYISPNGKPVTTEGLAPIYAFELNLVGPVNGKDAYLSSGDGTITYAAASPLFAANKDPQCTAARNIITEEQANIAYATLSPGPSKDITQAFNMETPHPYQPGNRFAVSQQSGRNQTDLFVVDNAGQLAVFYALGNGRWHSSKQLGPEGMAHPDTAVAASQHFGVDGQTDAFLFDQNGTLNQFHAGSEGAWKGPEIIGPKSLAHFGACIAATQHGGDDNRTDVFLVDKDGQLQLFWAAGSGKWNGPEQIGPINLTRAVASVTVSPRFGTKNQTDVYVVDTSGQLNVFSAVGSGAWSGPHKIGPAGLTVSGAAVAVGQKPGTSDQTQVFLFDNKGQLNVFSAGAGGQWSEPVVVGPQNVAPAGAPLVASPQFGVPNQADLFVINQAGSQTGATGQGWPTIFWSTGTDQWNGPKELVHDL